MANIAFIGLGNMGGPMTANLVKAGHKVTAFDLVAASRDQAKADGAAIGESAVAIAEEPLAALCFVVHGEWDLVIAKENGVCRLRGCDQIARREEVAMVRERASEALIVIHDVD